MDVSTSKAALLAELAEAEAYEKSQATPQVVAQAPAPVVPQAPVDTAPSQKDALLKELAEAEAYEKAQAPAPQATPTAVAPVAKAPVAKPGVITEEQLFKNLGPAMVDVKEASLTTNPKYLQAARDIYHFNEGRPSTLNDEDSVKYAREFTAWNTLNIASAGYYGAKLLSKGTPAQIEAFVWLDKSSIDVSLRGVYNGAKALLFDPSTWVSSATVVGGGPLVRVAAGAAAKKTLMAALYHKMLYAAGTTGKVAAIDMAIIGGTHNYIGQKVETKAALKESVSKTELVGAVGKSAAAGLVVGTGLGLAGSAGMALLTKMRKPKAAVVTPDVAPKKEDFVGPDKPAERTASIKTQVITDEIEVVNNTIKTKSKVLVPGAPLSAADKADALVADLPTKDSIKEALEAFNTKPLDAAPGVTPVTPKAVPVVTKTAPVIAKTVAADGSKVTTVSSTTSSVSAPKTVVPKVPVKMTMAATADVPAAAIAGADAVLPKDLVKATPKWKSKDLTFANDVDKAMYIVSREKPSKRDADYRAFLEKQGYSPEEITAGGVKVSAAIKAMDSAENTAAAAIGKADVDTGKVVYTLPADIKGAAPKWKTSEVSFDSDVDKALLIVSGKTPSKNAEKYISWLESTGIKREDIPALGAAVRANVKAAENAGAPGTKIHVGDTGAHAKAAPEASPTATIPESVKPMDVPEVVAEVVAKEAPVVAKVEDDLPAFVQDAAPKIAEEAPVVAKAATPKAIEIARVQKLAATEGPLKLPEVRPGNDHYNKYEMEGFAALQNYLAGKEAVDGIIPVSIELPNVTVQGFSLAEAWEKGGPRSLYMDPVKTYTKPVTITGIKVDSLKGSDGLSPNTGDVGITLLAIRPGTKKPVEMVVGLTTFSKVMTAEAKEAAEKAAVEAEAYAAKFEADWSAATKTKFDEVADTLESKGIYDDLVDNIRNLDIYNPKKYPIDNTRIKNILWDKFPKTTDTRELISAMSSADIVHFLELLNTQQLSKGSNDGLLKAVKETHAFIEKITKRVSDGPVAKAIPEADPVVTAAVKEAEDIIKAIEDDVAKVSPVEEASGTLGKTESSTLRYKEDDLPFAVEPTGLARGKLIIKQVQEWLNLKATGHRTNTELLDMGQDLEKQLDALPDAELTDAVNYLRGKATVDEAIVVSVALDLLHKKNVTEATRLSKEFSILKEGADDVRIREIVLELTAGEARYRAVIDAAKAFRSDAGARLQAGHIVTVHSPETTVEKLMDEYGLSPEAAIRELNDRIEDIQKTVEIEELVKPLDKRIKEANEDLSVPEVERLKNVALLGAEKVALQETYVSAALLGTPEVKALMETFDAVIRAAKAAGDEPEVMKQLEKKADAVYDYITKIEHTRNITRKRTIVTSLQRSVLTKGTKDAREKALKDAKKALAIAIRDAGENSVASKYGYKIMDIVRGFIFTTSSIVVNTVVPTVGVVGIPTVRLLVSESSYAARAEFTASYSSMWQMSGTALKLAKNALQYESPLLSRSTGIYGAKDLAIGGRVGGAIRFVPRIMGATDEFLGAIHYAGFIGARAAYDAATLGAEKGLTGKALKEFVNEAREAAVKAGFVPDSSDAADLAYVIRRKGKSLGYRGEKLKNYVAEGIRKNPEAMITARDAKAIEAADRAQLRKSYSGDGNISGFAKGYGEFFSRNPVLAIVSGQLFYTNIARSLEQAIRMTPGIQLMSPHFIKDLSGANGRGYMLRAKGEAMVGLAITSAVVMMYATGSIQGDQGGMGEYKTQKMATDAGLPGKYTITTPDGSTWNTVPADPLHMSMMFTVNALERLDALNLRKQQGEKIDESLFEQAKGLLSIGMAAAVNTVASANAASGVVGLYKMISSMDNPEENAAAIYKVISDKISYFVPNQLVKMAKANNPDIMEASTLSGVIANRTRSNDVGLTDIKTSHSVDVLGNRRQILDTGFLWGMFSTATPEERNRGLPQYQLDVMADMYQLSKDTGVEFETPIKNTLTGNLDLRSVLTKDGTQTLYDEWNDKYKALDPAKYLTTVFDTPMPEGTHATPGARVQVVKAIIASLREASFAQMMSEQQVVFDAMVSTINKKAKDQSGANDAPRLVK